MDSVQFIAHGPGQLVPPVDQSEAQAARPEAQLVQRPSRQLLRKLYFVERNTIRRGGEGAGSKKGGISTSGKEAARYHPQYPSSTQPYCAGTQKGPIPARDHLQSFAEQRQRIIYIFI